MRIKLSRSLFEQAQKIIPGGVNSPVRAFRSVGGTPRFIAAGQGAFIIDVDGNRYLDYVGSWGPLVLGHAHPEVSAAVQKVIASGTSFGAPTGLEIELAREIIDRVPAVEMVRLVNSGTEATMSAVRVARGVTGREKIIKFDGCYHGHSDSFLIAAGSGARTLGQPDSPGVTSGTAADTLLARFNDLESVARLFEAHPRRIAAVIIEPVAGNMGCIPPGEGFLRELQTLCNRAGALLILDEVMTGFRIARGGAVERYGIDADLVTFGKIIGGGMPIGAYGGKRRYMEQVAPQGSIYQAGTLSGNPVAVTAGLETLQRLTADTYAYLESLGQQLESGLSPVMAGVEVPLTLQRVGSMFTLFFHPGPVRNMDDVKQCDFKSFARCHRALLEKGIYTAPSQYEAGFLSAAHTAEDITRTVKVLGEILGSRP